MSFKATEMSYLLTVLGLNSHLLIGVFQQWLTVCPLCGDEVSRETTPPFVRMAVDPQASCLISEPELFHQLVTFRSVSIDVKLR